MPFLFNRHLQPNMFQYAHEVVQDQVEKKRMWPYIVVLLLVPPGYLWPSSGYTIRERSTNQNHCYYVVDSPPLSPPQTYTHRFARKYAIFIIFFLVKALFFVLLSFGFFSFIVFPAFYALSHPFLFGASCDVYMDRITRVAVS